MREVRNLRSARTHLEQMAPWPRRGVYFVALVVIYLSTASYARRPSIDVVAAELPAWAVAVHGTLDLTGLTTSSNPWLHEVNGGIYSDRFPGAIFYLIPGYWIASQLGFSSFSLIPGIVTAVVITATGVVIFDDFFRREFGPRLALVATTMVAFGSGAWSISANSPWSHTLNFLLIACLINTASRGNWTTSGLFWGLAITTRPTMAVGVATFGILVSWSHRALRPAVKVAAGAVPGVLGLLVYNYLLFGRFAPTNGLELSGDVRPHWDQLPYNILGALFSPARGVLIYYPILLVVLLVGFPAWRSARPLHRAALGAGVAVFLTQLTLNRYSGGYNFWGPRLAIEPLTLAVPFLVSGGKEVFQRLGPRVLWMVGITSIIIHGVGAILTQY